MLESDKFEYSRYSDVDQGVRLIDNIFDNAEKGKDDNTDKPSQFEQNLRDHTEHDFEYRGRKINTYIDNEPGLPDLFCSEVKSISVVRDNKGVDNITGRRYALPPPSTLSTSTRCQRNIVRVAARGLNIATS